MNAGCKKLGRTIDGVERRRIEVVRGGAWNRGSHRDTSVDRSPTVMQEPPSIAVDCPMLRAALKSGNSKPASGAAWFQVAGRRDALFNTNFDVADADAGLTVEECHRERT